VRRLRAPRRQGRGGEGESVSEIRFDRQVVLVTGSGRGLGAAYAKAFAARGAAVAVHDAGVEPDGTGGDPAVAEEVANEIVREGRNAAAFTENLESEPACVRLVERVAERFGRLDVVVQNAGLLVWEELERAHENWEPMRRVNVDAPFHITRAAFPFMKRQGYGRFVFTTSGRAMAVERTRPGLAAYAVGKMAHFALMIVTAAEASRTASARMPSLPLRPHACCAAPSSPVSSSPSRWFPAYSSSPRTGARSRGRCSRLPAASSTSRAGHRATKSTSGAGPWSQKRSPSAGVRSKE